MPVQAGRKATVSQITTLYSGGIQKNFEADGLNQQQATPDAPSDR